MNENTPPYLTVDPDQTVNRSNLEVNRMWAYVEAREQNGRV